MNVLLLANHCDTGGITSYLLTLSRGLISRGHKVWVVSGGGNCEQLFSALGVEHVRLDIRVKSEGHPKLYLALPTLMALIKNKDINIIHAHTRVTQVMSFIAGKITRRAFVSTCHGFFKLRLFRRIFPCWGQGVIAISRGVREHLLHDFKLNAQDVQLISNGIDLDQFQILESQQRQRLRQQWNVQGSPIIGIIARLSDVKGIDILIEAFSMVLNKFPQAQLWIVGQGPQGQNLQRLVEEKGLTARVHFEPVINRTCDILPIFDVFVMPSRQEGLGLSVMEAQGAGVPVIASNVGGLPDLIEDSKTGILFTVGQHEELAKKIITLLGHPEESIAMAKAARLNVQEKFSAQMMVSKTLEFYEQYISR